MSPAANLPGVRFKGIKRDTTVAARFQGGGNNGPGRVYGKELVIYDVVGDRLVLLPASGEGTPAALVDKLSRYVPNEGVKLSWSPDGKAIAFASTLMNNPLGGSPLFIVNADGSGLSKVPNAEHVAEVAWRPK